METDRLHDHPYLVVSIFAFSENIDSQIDLPVRSYLYLYILSHRLSLSALPAK